MKKFKTLKGEKVKEISTTISYHEERSGKFTASGNGNYCVTKWEDTQNKV